MSSVRRRLAATFAATTLLALSACGFEAQTNQQYQAAVGANVFGDVDVLNALLVANEDGSATVSAGFVNKTGEEQRLASVTITTLAGEELVVRSPKLPALPIPVDILTTLGSAGDTASFTVTQGAEAGYYVRATFTFSDSAPVTIEIPVVARTADYDKVTGGTPGGETEAESEETEEAAH
ncbi:hypothetical protein [Aeromicrobium sp.]|uniref:hypothetical protein n=1 Tax=Aeromicrobium sp. TaxID=1871063 RepID=UPI002FC86A23